MNKILAYIIIFLQINIAMGQTYGFEETAVPAGWLASQGVLSLSGEHYKEGSKSLCWETSGKSVLNVTFPAFLAGSANGAYLQIYASDITNDTLKVDFLYNSAVKRTASFLCNYKGWREFNRAYTEYVSGQSVNLNEVRFTLLPANAGNRKIYFDNVMLNYVTDDVRIAGSQWILDKSYFKADVTNLELYANPVDIPVITPSAAELTDLNALRTTLKRAPSAGSAAALAAAKTYVQSLNIVRNADGSVRGNVINTGTAALTTTFMTEITTRLEILAAAALNDPATMTVFQNLLDHLLDQGIAEGCNFEIASNNYTPARAIPANLLDILPACNPVQKTEVLKLVQWLCYYGSLYFPQNNYLINLNSDVVYLFTPHMLGVALSQSDDAVAVRELKAFKRFLDRNTEYVPGDGDILKPDGTGFHHATHYNNYMYSYKTWAEHMYYLKGTSFRVSPDAYQRFKKAVLALYTMSTIETGDTRYNANTFCGRNPFSSGMQIQFTRDLFEKLIQVGGDCLGTLYDNELASAYNFFFKTNRYNVTTKSFDGFYQFNYSPAGIYRRANWVATMHAPTTRFFGSEIYSGANRFGRYQSHGALEVMYTGTLARNGYPSNETGGGWDWNVIPGTTTVHYTNWQDMMPNRNTSDRFDQFAKTKNFSGALSFGDCGMFTTDFDQIDTWGTQKFTPTNLVFKKTVFGFENILISIGSGISSSGTYNASMLTATNLFQNIVSASTGSLVLNGTVLTKPHTGTIDTSSDNWIVSPQGTGYFIPKGNDPLELRLLDQTTPVESGADYAAPATTLPAAKAWLNHGLKPSSKSYAFVVVPATNSSAMQSLASQMSDGGGSVYKIQAQSNSVHALTYIPQNITAYSFFGATNNLNFGIVKASSHECLLMDKQDAAANRHYFAVCNPNLKPVADPTYKWVASTSQTTLTLSGEWYPVAPTDKVAFAAPASGQTQITVSFSNGEPVYFAVRLGGDTTSTNGIYENEWIKFSTDATHLHIALAENTGGDSLIDIYDASGQMIMQRKMDAGTSVMSIPVASVQPGLKICRVSNGKMNRIYKWKN